jgi:hypothetical protein
MNAADHLAEAAQYARWADENWLTDDMEAARTAAELSLMHQGMHRELWLTEVDLPRTELGVAAPVLDLPMRPDKPKAAAADTATADQHDPTTHQEA